MKTLPLVTILATSLFVASCSRESVNTNIAPPAPAAALATPSEYDGWRYRSYEDKMTGETSALAWVTSDNAFEMKFPYEGLQHAELEVSDSDQISFNIKEGQIDCRDSCLVLVKFDDRKATEYRWYASGTERHRISTLDEKLFEQLKTAKRMTMRVFFFQNGFFDFEFNVAGLKPVKKPEKKT